MKKKESDFKQSRFFRENRINREYSWLLFNERVLDQAADPSVPLLERCKFLSIFCSNLDEFFMVRVGSLVHQQRLEPNLRENKTNLTPGQQIEGILRECKRLYARRAEVFEQLREALNRAGISIRSAKELTPKQLEDCRAYFETRIMPFLSPLVLDAKHPLTHFENLNTYLVYELEKDGRTMYGVMALHPRLSRVHAIQRGKKTLIIPVEEIVRRFGDAAFPGYKVRAKAAVRVARNADFDANVEDADIEFDFDFSKYIKSKVELRGTMDAVRLETDCKRPSLREYLLRILNIKKQYCFKVEPFLDLRFLMGLSAVLPADVQSALRYAPFRGHVAPELANTRSLIDYVENQDIFLSYPYDSMDPLIRLLSECAEDSRVVSIKITIYRLDRHSRIVEALKRASENGKEVVAVFELTARFDEENNLYFANLLQEAGCTVFYGVSNYKVHSKVVSIVLADNDEVRYITHLGTGNYNESTSRQYTDLNIITSDREIGEDAAAFFRNVGVRNVDGNYHKLLLSPTTFKKGMLSYIDREIEKAKAGKTAKILAKMNSLTDREIIDRLTAASCAGVKIDLIIRGICCLLPGVPGATENITVTSIVGRFLEHSRVYCFGEERDRVMFISSADLMTRNTNRRVEIATPVLDKEIEAQILHILDVMLRDTVKARRLGPDGVYTRPLPAKGEEPLDAQEELLRERVFGR